MGGHYDCPKCGKWNKLSDYYKVTDTITPKHWDDEEHDPAEDAMHMLYGSGDD